MTDTDIFRRLQELRRRGIPACLATIVSAAGSTPRGVAAKMIVCADGTTYGSVGGGCGESRVRPCIVGNIRAVIARGRTRGTDQGTTRGRTRGRDGPGDVAHRMMN